MRVDTDRDIDGLLHDAGENWRSRQVFEDVSASRVTLRRGIGGRFGAASPALGLVAVAGLMAAAMAFGPLRLSGLGSDPAPSTYDEASAAPTGLLTPEEEDAARRLVVRAANNDPEQFGTPYLDDDGILVVQYFDEDARAALEADVTPGLVVRWERVAFSQSELDRIALEVVDLKLEGVVSISTGNRLNRVIVGVSPEDRVEAVKDSLARYGAAVYVEASELPVALPGQP